MALGQRNQTTETGSTFFNFFPRIAFLPVSLSERRSRRKSFRPLNNISTCSECNLHKTASVDDKRLTNLSQARVFFLFRIFSLSSLLLFYIARPFFPLQPHASTMTYRKLSLRRSFLRKKKDMSVVLKLLNRVRHGRSADDCSVN